MPLPNCRSSVIGGFLDTAYDLASSSNDRAAILAARAELDGEWEHELEDRRAQALAMWATHRWAALCLELAGFEETAREVREAENAEAAGELMASYEREIPKEPAGQPKSLDDDAGLAAARATGAAFQIFRSTGPAMAAMCACDATRRAKAAGQYPVALKAADEILAAARAAMDFKGPPGAI